MFVFNGDDGSRVRRNANYVPDRRASERNLHCDLHVTAENKHTLPPVGSVDSFWIMRLQRSRRRDKALCHRTRMRYYNTIQSNLFQL